MQKDQWNAGLYDQKHAFVSKYGSEVVDLLAPQAGEKILDLGCGTGDLTKEIFDLNGLVTGIDQSENMITEAKRKYPHIDFTVQNAESLVYDRDFNAVFSNATLHWIKTPESVLQGVFRSLKQQGRFVAEFGAKGNVKTITDEIVYQLHRHRVAYHDNQFPWYFPSIGEYTALMEKAGFKVTMAQHFDRLTPLEGEEGLKNWIHMFGQTIFKSMDYETKENVINQVQQRLKKKLLADGTWFADYQRIRVVGVKEQ